MQNTTFNVAEVTIGQHNSLASAARCVIQAEGYNAHALARTQFVKQLFNICNCFTNDSDALYAIIDAYNAHSVQISHAINNTNAQRLNTAEAKAQFAQLCNEKLPMAIAALAKYVEACATA